MPHPDDVKYWQDTIKYHAMYEAYLVARRTKSVLEGEVTLPDMMRAAEGRLKPDEVTDFLAVANAGLLRC